MLRAIPVLDEKNVVRGQSCGYLDEKYELALVPQHEERGDHLLTDISDSLPVRGVVVLEGLLQ